MLLILTKLTELTIVTLINQTEYFNEITKKINK